MSDAPSDVTVLPAPPPPEAPPSGPYAPPPAAWQEAASTLQHRQEALAEAVEELWGSWQAQVRRTLVAPLEAAIRRSAAAHRMICRDLQLEAEASGRAAWHRAFTYHRQTQERVLRPLCDHLGRTNPGVVLDTALAHLLASLREQAGDVPRRTTVPTPADLYADRGADSFWWTLRKVGTRSGQHLSLRHRQGLNVLRRAVGQTAQPVHPPGQTVPAKHLWQYHLDVRLPASFEAASLTLQQAAVDLVARLETTVAEWTRTVLHADVALDRAAYHPPPTVGVDARPPAEPEAAEAPPVPRAPLASALQEVLDVLAVTWPEDALDRLHQQLEAHRRALAEDVRHGGTFLLPLRRRPLPRLPEPDAERPVSAWAVWHTQAQHRMLLNHHLEALRSLLVDQEDHLLTRVAQATLKPVHEVFGPAHERLTNAREALSAQCSQPDEDPEALRRILRTTDRSLATYLDQHLANVRGLVAADQVLSEPGHDEWERVTKRLAALPDTLAVHPLAPDVPPRPVPPNQVIEISLREIAEDALRVPWSTFLKDAAAALRQRVTRIWSNTEQVPHIVQFNLEAALEELDKPTSPLPDGTSSEDVPPEPSPWASACELSSNGLRRACETLDELSMEAYPAWEAFVEATFQTTQSDWEMLRSRVRAEDLADEQWASRRQRWQRFLGRQQRRLGEVWTQRLEKAKKLVRLGSRQARGLIRKGQNVVGVLENSTDAEQTTLDALTGIEALRASLPLVYRKLFSFEPVHVSTLLEGRSRTLVRLRTHFTRWQKHRTLGTRILPLPMGSGRTSLLNIMETSVFNDVTTHRVAFRERMLDEERFATLVAEALEIQLTSEAPVTLDALETEIRARPARQAPVVFLIDDLEHLVLRAPEGSVLFERALIFFSRTDSHVYWVATISQHTWHFVTQTGKASSGLTSVHTVDPIDRAGLEKIIIGRHRRSGMPLHFVDTGTHGALIRQRLRRARTPEQQQEILREEYFNKLHRLCGQNILLGLLYWLRSANFEAKPDVLTLTPPEALDFSFLGTIDLATAFTLKTFLLHNTLTLEEHNRIFRMNSAKSTFILEALLNRRIIDPCAPDHFVEQTGVIVSGERYRISPFLIHPVTEQLRSRRIVY
ncbi:MAG: hypothetical protein AAF970_09795 [Bacteroidota bacterium]